MKGGSGMRHIDKQKWSVGFTIVETLIVLAVTSAIFFSAVLALGGKISTTEFNQAITDIQAQIQQTINDTANGYYPNASDFTCTKSASGSLNIVAGTTSQGENRDCTFIGKVIQFKVGGTDPEQYITYPIVGLRCAASATGICESPSLAESKPVALVKPGVDASVSNNLHNGLTTHYLQYNSGNVASGAVGFIANPATLGAGASGKAAGVQATGLYVVDGTALDESKSFTVNKIDAVGSLIPVTGGVRICFASGGTDQSGLLTIGGTKGQPTSVTVKIFANKTCA